MLQAFSRANMISCLEALALHSSWAWSFDIDYLLTFGPPAKEVACSLKLATYKTNSCCLHSQSTALTTYTYIPLPCCYHSVLLHSCHCHNRQAYDLTISSSQVLSTYLKLTILTRHCDDTQHCHHPSIICYKSIKELEYVVCGRSYVFLASLHKVGHVVSTFTLKKRTIISQASLHIHIGKAGACCFTRVHKRII